MTITPHENARRKKIMCQPLYKERGPGIRERVQRLVHEMKLAIDNNEPINLSNPPHREITEALHEVVYAQSSKPAGLSVFYNDVNPNINRKKFPVYCLTTPVRYPNWNNQNILEKMINIGTLSFRHVSYDDFVDFYLIRDRETRALNSYEIQDLAYERMLDVLKDPLLEDELYISLFQTGLEPLVIGAYQAITEHLHFRATKKLPSLYVRPVFFAARNERGDDDLDVGGKKYWG